MKRVLITGVHGYISNYIKQHFTNIQKTKYNIQLLDLHGTEWEKESFKNVDAIIHCAALVHKDSSKFSLQEYIMVNAELTERLAKKAKNEGVKYFVFMSTEGVYGTSGSLYKDIVLDLNTPLRPIEKYEISKKMAEDKLLALQDEEFKVAILRPPFVYGNGCPGNYKKLREAVLKIGIIPLIKNKKSMIYVENLCEFVYQIWIRKLSGIFLPQDLPYRCTTDMCLEIAKCHNKQVLCTRIFNFLIKLLSLKIRSIRVAFGDEYYDAEVSKTEFRYSLVNFDESIRRTENEGVENE